MHDLEKLIHVAWTRVSAAVLHDQHELARRLARRRAAVLRRPPRAWCLALRASDTRIRAGEHVALTRELLVELCAHVTIPAPGLMLDELAHLLGTTPMGLRNGRIAGVLRTRHIKGLAGRRAKPVPLVYTDQPLDPNAKGFALADAAWFWTASYLTCLIPRDLHQLLTRIVHYSSHVGRHAYDEHRHPEVDAVGSPRKSKRLPPPQPDNVWYKWSRSGHYLGDDPSNWRKWPEDLGERPPRYLPKRRYKKRFRPSQSSGSLHFNGHQWLCPVCGKTCRTIYFPLPRTKFLDDVRRLAQIIDIPPYADGFACHRCHRVRFFTRTSEDAWNQLIAYLSGGLLYGREVERPKWFTISRRRPYRPHSQPRPAIRRQQVLDHLLKGETRATIAAALHMSPESVTQHINKIYKSERIKGQRALLKKYNIALPPHLTLKRDHVLAALRAGRATPEIAAALHIRLESVERYLRDLRRLGHLSPVASAHRGS